MLRCSWQANAHEESLYFAITTFIGLNERSCCFVYFATHGGAVFSFVFINDVCGFNLDEKGGAGNLQEKESGNQRSKARLSAM